MALKIKSGEMFAAVENARTPQALIVTTNGTLTHKNVLIMGSGSAAKLKEHFPAEANRISGIAVRRTVLKDYRPRKILPGNEHLVRTPFRYCQYGLILVPCVPPERALLVGALQVKVGYFEEADVKLIRKNVGRLANIAASAPSVIFNVNFPGIGCGGLTQKEVMSCIEDLDIPVNLNFWKFANP